MRRLLIIPGLGDHNWAYRLTLPFWWLHGFRARVYDFNWSNDDGKFDQRFAALLIYMEGHNWYIVGGSAGGVVTACVLSARPDLVIRAAALCSPVTATELVSTNTVLHQAIQHLKALLASSDAELRGRLLSLWCASDHVIKPRLTKLQGAVQEETPGTGHAKAIARALSIGSGRIARWLRTGA